ncbi:MAG TPA: nucleoside monophosphate kinase, partial [Candidatus Limnocylindria bacterium]|nr:nucleoside monophosphate kinase [Candidatus Limnocylindria bacterium]
MQKNVFVFIGPPGSGKGSISKLCVQKFKWAQLSTGNLCRLHIVNQTEIGKEIAFAIKSGNLISDSLITGMVEQWLTEKIEGVNALILDGYPRAVPQAKAFHDIIAARFPWIRLNVVKFTAPQDQIVCRLSSRLVCRNGDCQAVYSQLEGALQPKQAMQCDDCSGPLGQRDDDRVEAIRERLSIYYRHENDLVNFYHSVGHPVVELNAFAPLE